MIATMIECPPCCLGSDDPPRMAGVHRAWFVRTDYRHLQAA